MDDISVVSEGADIVMTVNGRSVVIPPHVARQVGKALIAKAGKAEEAINHEQVVFDHAVLARAGVPVGLTSDPYLMHAAMVEAQHNKRIRTSNIGPNRAKEEFGTPTILGGAVIVRRRSRGRRSGDD